MIEVIQIDHDGTGRYILTLTDLTQAENAGKRRTDDAVVEAFLRGLNARTGRVARSNHGIELAFGDQLPALQVLQTRDLRVQIIQIGLGLGQLGFDRTGIQLDQNLSFGYPLAAFETHGRDALGLLGGDDHGFTGLGRADGLDTVTPGFRSDCDYGHRRRRAGISAGAFFIAAAGRRQQNQRHQ